MAGLLPGYVEAKIGKYCLFEVDVHDVHPERAGVLQPRCKSA